jgi:hypothetical protein
VRGFTLSFDALGKTGRNNMKLTDAVPSSLPATSLCLLPFSYSEGVGVRVSFPRTTVVLLVLVTIVMKDFFLEVGPTYRFFFLLCWAGQL